MARIFYFTATGDIYGVHHSPHEDDPRIRLPKGVAWIDVPEPSHQIPWPSPDGTRSGEGAARRHLGAEGLDTARGRRDEQRGVRCRIPDSAKVA